MVREGWRNGEGRGGREDRRIRDRRSLIDSQKANRIEIIKSAREDRLERSCDGETEVNKREGQRSDGGRAREEGRRREILQFSLFFLSPLLYPLRCSQSSRQRQLSLRPLVQPHSSYDLVSAVTQQEKTH